MVHEADVWAALGHVQDPEMPLSIVDMGLVYAVRLQPGASGALVSVDLTYTAMGCPAMGLIRGDVQAALADLPGVGDVRINTVWDPPWTKAKLSARARETLRAVGVGV